MGRIQTLEKESSLKDLLIVEMESKLNNIRENLTTKINNLEEDLAMKESRIKSMEQEVFSKADVSNLIKDISNNISSANESESKSGKKEEVSPASMKPHTVKSFIEERSYSGSLKTNLNEKQNDPPDPFPPAPPRQNHEHEQHHMSGNDPRHLVQQQGQGWLN